MEATKTKTNPVTSEEGDAPDKYEVAVDYLTAHPEEICRAWMLPLFHPAGCLFVFVEPHGIPNSTTPSGEACGCLTMIRHGGYAAWTPELTRLIRADTRIPKCTSEITVDHLPILAGWQRRIDKELNRV